MVRVPRRLQELQAELAAAIGLLSQDLGRSPTVAEVARRLEITDEEVLEAMESARAYSAVPIDVPHSVTGLTVADTLVDADEAMEHVELRHMLRPVLAELPERDRTALMMRFLHNKTQSEIAEVLGISQVHVSRVLAKTLKHLKEALTDDGENPTRT
jgi:RNA polymerase sigma-B factor